MGLALHRHSHHWRPISTASCNRDVELRVSEGTATSSLEFPCQLTNAGDWINGDLRTPIKIQPVEWRVWQHSIRLQKNLATMAYMLIGTVIIALLIGQIVHYAMPQCRKLLLKIVGEEDDQFLFENKD